MQRWTKQEFIDAVESCEEGEERIDEYFAKHKIKSASLLTVLNASITKDEKQYIIWCLDTPLWMKAYFASGIESTILLCDDLEAFAKFEQYIRAELKASK